MSGAQFRSFAATKCGRIFARWPGSRPLSSSSCPVHGTPLGKSSRMCLACHEAAWAEVGAAYARAKPGRPTDE